MAAHIPSIQPQVTGEATIAQAAISATPVNPRKRRASNNAGSPSTLVTSALATDTALPTAPPATSESATKKKGRTNTPWTPEEEQKLQHMRGESKGWSEIAKVT
jgi:hypothetical protein